MKEEDIEWIEHEIPLAWGCYIAVGLLALFALSIVVIVVVLMA